MIIYDRKLQQGGKSNKVIDAYVGMKTGFDKSPYVADTESTARETYAPVQVDKGIQFPSNYKNVAAPKPDNNAFLRKIGLAGVTGLESIYDGLAYWANAGK